MAQLRWHISYLRQVLVHVVFLLTITSFLVDGSQFVQSHVRPEGPVFLLEPLDRVEFSNRSGARVECQARGHPQPTVSWLLADGSPLSPVSGLRQVIPDGTLVFPPFRAEDYRQDVHAVAYRCVATNVHGTIVSREVNVKAVVAQPYEVYVYDVYAIRGNAAVMKCHVPTFLQDYISAVSWVKNGAFAIPTTKVEENGKYVFLEGGHLVVNHVGEEDAGHSFRCQTQHRLTGEFRTSLTAGKLYVTDPQGSVPPRISAGEISVTGGKGDTAILPCVAQGYPAPTTNWYTQVGHGNLQALPRNARFTIKASALLIHELQAEDSAVYVCEATNAMGAERIYTRLIVTTSLTVKVQPSLVMADIGKAVTFHCTTIGLPVATITWLKDGVPLPAEDVHFQDVHALTIQSVTASHRGMYQCLAKNDIASAQAAVELRLGDTPAELVSVFKGQLLHPGDSLALKCIAIGTPSPQITWSLDDMPSSKGRTQEPDNGQVVSWLNISSVRIEDSGIYTCTATTKAGKSQHSARINVYGPLAVRKRPPVKAVADRSAVIHCPIVGYPWESISWEKEGFMLPVNHRQNVFKNGTLVIEHVRRTADSGRYHCSVSSKTSKHVAKGQVEVSVLVPPKIIPFSFQDALLREGSRARLQCVVSEGDLPITIKWVKDEVPIPPNVGVVVRDLDDFSSILTIPTILPRHNGNYTCLASNAAGTTRHRAELFVNVSPKISPFSFQEESTFQGALTRLSCVVYQGDLPITLTWFKDGQNVTSNYMGISTRALDEYSSILTIDKINPQHNGNYTCEAQNSASKVSHTAQLKVKVPPKIVPFIFQDEHLLEGMLVRVSCVVSEGDLPLSITWLKDGYEIPLQLSVTMRDFDEYSSVLSINPLTVQHSGNYTCIANNHAGIATHTAKLTVNVPPYWRIEPQDQTVAKGHAVTIPCDADGFPFPTTRWMKVEGNDPTGKKTMVTSSAKINFLLNGSLRITSASEEHRGYYFCIASNGIGHDLGKLMHLSVLAPPSINQKRRTQTAVYGEDVTLECEVTGNLPIKVSWAVEDNLIVSDNISNRFQVKQLDYVEKNVVLSQLTIPQVTRKDSTSHICFAQNSHGKDESTIQLVVMESPSRPENIEVKWAGNRTVQVSWDVPFDGNNKIVHYIVEYKKASDKWEGHTHEVSVYGSDTNTKVEKLTPATTFYFRVRAENEVGVGNASEIVSFTTEEEAPAGPPLNVEVEPTDATSLRVSWKPPDKSQRNGAIRGYNIGYKEHQLVDPYTFTTLEVPEDYSEDLVYQISDLKMYTQYDIVVQAYNSIGKGPLSEDVVILTSEDVPSQPPVDVRCSSLSSRSIYVIWDQPPPNSVNGILRGYRVLFRAAHVTSEVLLQSKVSQVAKITLSELEINTNYSIQVLAFTKMGDGARSQAVFCKTHEDVPGSPDDIKVLPTSVESVLVSWKPPARSNGAVHKYNVYVKPIEDEGQEIHYSKDFPHTDANYDNVRTTEASSLFYEITGLKKNKRYQFWVTALSSIGEGPSSKTITEIPTGPTLAAKSSSFDDLIKTPWKKDVVMPCRAVGTPLPEKKWLLGLKPIKESSRIHFRPDGALQITRIEQNDSGNYTCSVTNQYGKDEVTYCVIVQVPPSAPFLDIVSKSLTSVHLQWKKGDTGGDEIRGYTIHFRRDNGQWEKKDLSGDMESYILEKLACGAKYQIYMVAENTVGVGQPCDVINISTKDDDTSLPARDELIREGATFATVYLDAWPMSGCPVQHFTVEYRVQSSNKWKMVGKNIKQMQRKVVIPDLTPATYYILRLTAYTSSGPTPTEYNFFTHTAFGGVPPPQVVQTGDEKMIMFTFDPMIVIPIIVMGALLLLSIIFLCLFCQSRTRSATKHSSNVKDWMRSSAIGTVPGARRNRRSVNSFVHAKERGGRITGSYPSLNGHQLEDPVPYATSQLSSQNPRNDSGISSDETFSSDGNWKDKKCALELSVRRSSDSGSQPGIAAQMWLQAHNNAAARRSMFPELPSNSSSGLQAGSSANLSQDVPFSPKHCSRPHSEVMKETPNEKHSPKHHSKNK